jgi:glycerol-3-phosphate acyltransferase PlsY
MLRTYGKKPAIVTALGDFLKAFAAVMLARAFGGGIPVDIGYLAGIFVIIGHLFPLYFRFKGGKGVMSTLGVIAAVDLPLFVMILACTLPLIFITRIISISSIAGAFIFVAFTCEQAFEHAFVWYSEYDAYGGLISNELVFSLSHNYPLYYSICAVIIGGLLIFVHRENIGRLRNGTENRFGKKKTDG